MSQVVIFRSYDPVAVELAEARLRAAEIPFIRAGRGSAALLGMGHLALEQLVTVSPEYAQHARELLAVTGVEDDDDVAYEAEPPAERKAAFRQHLIALGLALFFPGFAIAYVGFPLAGFALVGWTISTIVEGQTSAHPLVLAFFGQILPRVIDVVGSQTWLRRAGRGGVLARHDLALAIVLVAALYFGHRLFD